MTFYAATCPSCGAAIAGTLASDPDVPMYDCGGWGRRCGRPTWSAPTADDWPATPTLVDELAMPNVRSLTAAEAIELGELTDVAEIAITRASSHAGRA